MKKNLCMVTLILSVFCSHTVFAMDKQEVPTTNNQKAVQQAVGSELEAIQQAVKNNDFSYAIAHLEYLTKKVKELQSRELDKFLPVECDGFKKKTIVTVPGEPNIDDNNYVLYRKTYQDSDGNMINVYVVASDPIIRDYMTMISSQKVLKRFQNKSILKMGNYEAIVTGSPGENYIEHNIVINSDLLVNVFYIGKIQPETIAKFTSKMDLNRLENYLKK